MSGHSDSGECPSCGGYMNIYTDWKPHDQVSGECLECGFSYYTKAEQATLEDINNLRAELNDEDEDGNETYPPLKELVKGTFFDEEAQNESI